MSTSSFLRYNAYTVYLRLLKSAAYNTSLTEEMDKEDKRDFCVCFEQYGKVVLESSNISVHARDGF